MTRRSIVHQLHIIRQATANASVSPEAAADFLKRAGLAKKVGSIHSVKKSGAAGAANAASNTVGAPKAKPPVKAIEAYVSKLKSDAVVRAKSEAVVAKNPTVRARKGASVRLSSKKSK